MKTIAEMHEERKALLKKCRELNDSALKESRDFTDEEQGQYDGWKDEIRSLGVQIKRAEELEAEERALQEYKPPQPANPDNPEATNHRAEVDEPEVKKDKKGGFRSLSHFCHDIYQAGEGMHRPSETLDTWIRAAGTPSQAVGDLTSGGALIPVEFSNRFLELGTERSDILNKAMILPMKTNAIDVPYLDGFNETGGKVAGNVLFYWKGEEKQYVASDYEVGGVKLTLNKCTGLAFLTDEIMKFSPNMAEPLLMKAFAKGYIKAITKACIRGTGAGQPLGVLNDSATLITIDKETGQLADTIKLENLTKMFARLYSEEESGGGGVWYTNKTAIPQLLTLSLAVGTGGAAVSINNVQEKPGFVIWGDKVRFSSMMSALGDLGDILYADWSQYLIGFPEGDGDYEVAQSIHQSIHLKFDYGQTAFRFTFYMDGRPWWPEKFTPQYGDTMSPFITLAERA